MNEPQDTAPEPIQVTAQEFQTPAADPVVSDDPVVALAGVPEGTVIVTPAEVPNEVIVADRNDKDEVIGWHKEAE